jgi:ADP-heptose:LPS heptosyltransferase
VAAVGQPRLLVLRALGLGDLLTAVPALRALAEAFPTHHRILACPRALEPLASLTGAIDEVVDTAPLAPLDASLANVDIAVNLHGRGPQSHRLLQALEPGRLIAFANGEAEVTGPQWLAHEHEVDRWCRMLEESGIPADTSRLGLDPPGAAIPAWLHGATVIHPGAASPARRWPVERFAEVARAEARDGRRVAVTGAAAEQDLAFELAHLADLPCDAVLAGRTDLTQLAEVVAAAARVVCGDTGVAHLGTAMNTPSVVLFGPVSPHEWGPPADSSRHRTLWGGSTGDPHAALPDPGLLQIEVDDVLAALAELPAPAFSAA